MCFSTLKDRSFGAEEFLFGGFLRVLLTVRISKSISSNKSESDLIKLQLLLNKNCYLNKNCKNKLSIWVERIFEL